MDKKALEAFAREAAKSIKTESDLNNFRKMLTKVTVETALNVSLMSTLATKNTLKNQTPIPAMAKKRTPMNKIKEVLRLKYDCGLSNRSIALALNSAPPPYRNS